MEVPIATFDHINSKIYAKFNEMLLKRPAFLSIDKFSKAFSQLQKDVDFCFPSTLAFMYSQTSLYNLGEGTY